VGKYPRILRSAASFFSICSLRWVGVIFKYDAKATFFITGINNGKGAIDDLTLPWASLIERMH
jgi:hypothetical protein